MLFIRQISSVDLLCALHKCKVERNLVQAHHLYDVFMSHVSLPETQELLGNHLVSVLVELESISQAQQVFDLLDSPDQCSWNALITGYVKLGEPQNAINLYKKMGLVSCLSPSGHAYVALIKACTALNDLENGCKLHSEIVNARLLQRDVFVCSTLVDMYAKCGSLEKAQEVFDGLSDRDVISWTALVAGYIEHGHPAKALYYFDQMQRGGLSADAPIFVCSLRACSSLKQICKGQEIHSDVARKGLEAESFVGNIIVDMYAKCGLFTTALAVFNKLPIRDGISWNAVITGYAEHGYGEEALEHFKQMHEKGLYQDTISFVGGLKSCSCIGARREGQEMHTELTWRGQEVEILIGSTLVNMYSKCGLLKDAHDVLDKLPSLNSVMWNELMAGYLQNKHGKEALSCYKEMEYYKISRNTITYVFGLKACGSIGATLSGHEIHSEITKMGLQNECIIGSALVGMYAKCGLLMEAQEVFKKLEDRDVVTWTVLLAGYSEHGQNERVLCCYERMQQECISLNAISYVCILQACGKAGYINNGRKIHIDITKKGLEEEILVGSSLIDMYVKCGSLGEAEQVFYRLPSHNLLTWNPLILGYCEHGYNEKALDCFDQLRMENILHNIMTFVCTLKASGSLGVMVKGWQIHCEVLMRGLDCELVIGNTLIDMYAKCGMLTEAQAVFDKLPVADVVSWTTIMAGYAQLGESEIVFHLFDDMIERGFKPNSVTLLSVLNACTHVGELCKGHLYFEASVHCFGLQPTVDHYTCIIDILGRAGNIDSIVALIMKMPLHPDAMVWQKILGGCTRQGHIEIGKHAFEHAVRLDENDATAYVYLSNIYASFAHDVEELRL